MNEVSTTKIEIRDMTVGGEASAGTPEIVLRHEGWDTGSGSEDGAVMVRLNVDGESFNVVQLDDLGQR